MQTHVLLSCVKSKQPHPCPAGEMYISAWFIKAMTYGRRLKPDRLFILSAQHGLLSPETVIEPYEKTLNSMGRTERMEWARRVLAQLRTKTDFERDRFIFLAGERYREFLVPHLRHHAVPMDGLRIGRQLQWLTERAA